MSKITFLIVQDHEGSSPENHFAAYDGNGNVVGLIDSVTGEKSATYEYSPFGELIRVSGEMGMKNTLRYSSRYTDDETGLLYYGYRYYSPALGKWLSPDPIEESGGMNVFGFLGSDPVNAVDVLGMFGSCRGNWWPAPRPTLPDPSKPIPDDLTRDELEDQLEAYRDYGEGEIKSLEFAEAATWFAIDILASEEGVRAIQNGQIGVAAKVFATDAVVGKAFKLVKYVKKAGDFVRCCDTYAVSFKKIPEEKIDISGSTSLCSNAPKKIHGNSNTSQRPTEHYVIRDQNGKPYDGVGDVDGKRANDSKVRLEKENSGYNFEIVSRTPYNNRADALKAEDRGIWRQGVGPDGKNPDGGNYNKINSPGRRLNDNDT